MSSNSESPVKIRLLGAFEVEREGYTLRAEDWSRKKAAALLKRLALERRLLKDQAIDFLWLEVDPGSAANNLYKTIHTLRQTLNTHLGPGAASAIIRFEDGILSLLPSVWVDTQEFEHLCTASERSASDLEAALDLYQGDLLPDDLYEDWTQLPRQELFRYQRETRMALSIHRRNARDYAAAIQLLTPLLAHDPADEATHRELMRLYTLAGQRHYALRQYQACADALAAEIDVPPSPETAALYAQILNGELSPPSAPVQAPWSPPAPVVLEAQRAPGWAHR